jgi:peptidoglycan/xylan/chitin deacetylase (PgdA/CDA1 family)
MRGTNAPIFAVAIAAAGLAGLLSASLPVHAEDCPGNPDALGTSRVLTIDPAEHMHIGVMQYHDTLPLNDHEVVLTFDDGPLQPHTGNILNILASECVKATYFLVGEMARAHPEAVRRIHAEGHTIGTHSENHPTRFDRITVDRMREQIDDGIAEVTAALGDPSAVAPFFRFPGLGRTDAAEALLAERGIAAFSSDTVADDWRRVSAAKIVTLAISRLEARGKGILLLHDIHRVTEQALPDLLKQLKAHGFHIVHVVPTPPIEVANAEIDVTSAIKPWAEAFAGPQRKIMDDRSYPRNWPGVDLRHLDKPAPDATALPAPDGAVFDRASAGADMTPAPEIAVNEAGFVEPQAEAPPPWPARVARALTTDVGLPAPGLQDIGIPTIGHTLVGEASRASHTEAHTHTSEHVRSHTIRHGRGSSRRQAGMFEGGRTFAAFLGPGRKTAQ